MKKLFFLFLSLFLFTKCFALEFKTVNCQGHSSICEDPFVMKFTFSKNEDDNIYISNHNLLEHRHSVKIIKFKNYYKDKHFILKFYLINNLNNKFLFEITGYNQNNILKDINLNISLNEELLAKYNLEEIT